MLTFIPPAVNGSANGVLQTARRIGSALGIAVIATVLFGALLPAGPALAAAFSHSFQAMLTVNIAVIIGALALAIAAPGVYYDSRAATSAVPEPMFPPIAVMVLPSFRVSGQLPEVHLTTARSHHG